MNRTTEEIEKVAAELIDFTQADTIELLHIFKTKYGLVPAVAAVTPQNTEDSTKKKESIEKTVFDVVLLSTMEGKDKLHAVKALNTIINIGLKPSMALLTGEMPAILKKNCSKSEAESMKETLEAFGAQIELR